MGVENPTVEYERNEKRAQDIVFVRSFLQQMDQVRVVRWRSNGDLSFLTSEQMTKMQESDAEHTGQMHSLLTCIKLKAQQENDQTFDTDLDMEKARTMIGLHDIDENLIGDARQKDEAYYMREKKAREVIFEQLQSLNFGEQLKEVQLEYLEKSSKEARLVKAIDEIQAWFYLIYTRQFKELNRNFNEPESISGYLCAQEFPTVKRIADILLWILQHPTMIRDEMVNLELLKMEYN